MPTKNEKRQAQKLIDYLLDNDVPQSDPAWTQARILMGIGEEQPKAEPKPKRRPVATKYHNAPGRPANLSAKKREMARRKQLYPEMIDRGLRNVDMAMELGISRSVVSHDLALLGLHAHQRMYWRVTNVDTGKVTHYTSIDMLNAAMRVRPELKAGHSVILVGPWTIEHGCWYQDSKGVWREAPNESL
jgi:hypothetical protein